MAGNDELLLLLLLLSPYTQTASVSGGRLLCNQQGKVKERRSGRTAQAQHSPQQQQLTSCEGKQSGAAIDERRTHTRVASEQVSSCSSGDRVTRRRHSRRSPASLFLPLTVPCSSLNGSAAIARVNDGKVEEEVTLDDDDGMMFATHHSLSLSLSLSSQAPSLISHTHTKADRLRSRMQCASAEATLSSLAVAASAILSLSPAQSFVVRFRRQASRAISDRAPRLR